MGLAHRDADLAVDERPHALDERRVVAAATALLPGMLQGRYPVRDGRLRRVQVVTDKRISSKARMDALARRKSTAYREALEIPAITVRDHPNAPFGSWQVGDDVLVQVEVPWVGEVALWHRVVSDELSDTDLATLFLVRSDAFA